MRVLITDGIEKTGVEITRKVVEVPNAPVNQHKPLPA
jgi:hypothetical protein